MNEYSTYEAGNVKMLMDNTNQLITYIVEELKRGATESSIRAALGRAGWPVDPVNKAFAMLRQDQLVQTSSVSLPSVDPMTSSVHSVTVEPVSLSQPSKSYGPWIALAILCIMLLGAGSIFFIMKGSLGKQHTPPPISSVDQQRRETLDHLASKLVSYYGKRGTYPTLQQMNQPSFATAAQGFDLTSYHDPDWKKTNTDCSDHEKVVLAAHRSNGCFAYRTTARNGADCDASTTRCTHMVLTANLENRKPYIIALDQTQRQQ